MIQIIKDYFNIIDAYKRNFANSVILAVVRGLFEAIQIIALYLALQDIFNNSITMFSVFRTIFMIVIGIIGAVITGSHSSIQKTISGYGGGAMARIKIAEHLKSVGMGYFNEKSLGNVSAVATNAVQYIQEGGSSIVFSLLDGTISSIIISVVVFIFNWKIGLIAFVGIILFLFTISWMQKRGERHTDAYSSMDSEIVESVIEFIQGLPVVKSYNRDTIESDKMQKDIQEHSELMYKLERDWIPIASLQKIILGCTGVAIIGASLYLNINGSMETYEMLTMMIISWMLFYPLQLAGQFAFLLRQLGNNQKKIQEILDIPPMDMNVNKEGNIAKEHDIEFSHVDFSYGSRQILKDISFTVPENTTTAIIGPSGGGKTTIINLIARFFDINKGNIFIGGMDVKDYSLDLLMSKISIVFQDVYLFHDTIANNIRFGNSNATLEEVKAAAKKACCDDFIEALPEGYDTVIEEGGTSLSGGEKQRISIARCLMKNAPIVLLDEATANVDPENEVKIKNAIEALLHEKTVVMIAHRLNTVINADQIIALKDGIIVQKGTHKELSKESGVYKEFLDVRRAAISWKI